MVRYKEWTENEWKKQPIVKAWRTIAQDHYNKVWLFGSNI